MANGSDATPKVETRKTNMTVFDLQVFDDVKLTLEVPLPTKPDSIEAALAAVGNSKDALLKVIHDGLCEQAVEDAKKHPETFHVVDEEGEAGELYTGTPVDEKKGKSINLSVLNLAKAMGYDKSLPLVKRNELKKQAFDALRSNPALIAMLQG